MVTMCHAVVISAASAATVCAAMALQPPESRARLEAIGPTNGLSATLQRAFAADDGFVSVPVPGPNDWLAAHRESGQTFEQFQHSHPNRPDARRRIIYLQPMGVFLAQQSPSLEKLHDYAAAFFQMEVKTLEPLTIEAGRFTNRTNSMTGRRQILSEDVLQWLKARMPPDAFCLVAITMEDLYPEPSWNFVFGQASLTDRVAVYSFARYDPAFYGDARGSDYQALLLRRSMKVLTHETGHIFGLAHCIYFHCVMNGSNHLLESDRRPLHLCPVCLRKLQFSLGFDVLKRYQDLARLDEEAGFIDEAAWLRKRLEKLRASSR